MEVESTEEHQPEVFQLAAFPSSRFLSIVPTSAVTTDRTILAEAHHLDGLGLPPPPFPSAMCSLTGHMLENRSAGDGRGRKRMRCEENSGIQKVRERRVRCGEIRIGRGCGEGLARNGKGAAWSSSCSRNAHDRNVLVRRAQSRINQAAPKDAGKRAWKGWGEWPDDLLCSRNARPQTDGGSNQVPFRARGTPTMKLWSFDARSKGQPGYSLAGEADDL